MDTTITIVSKVPRRLLLQRELVLFLIFGTIVAFSFYLTPSPKLYGTHTQLGLPQCPSVALFHVRCPTCGMTTSFTACAHGLWGMAFRAHPAGPFLWLATVFATLFYFGQFATGRRIDLGISPKLQSRLYVYSFAAIVVCAGIRELLRL